MTAKPSVFGNGFFYDMQLNGLYKELVPYSVLSSSKVCIILVFLLTQRTKRQGTHLSNSVYRKEGERISDFILCSVSVGLLTNSEMHNNRTATLMNISMAHEP